MTKVLPVLVLFIFAPAIFLFSPIFEVRNFGINNQDCIKEEQVEKIIQNKNFFLIDEKKLAENLQSQFICVAQVTVKKRFPKTLKIEVAIKQPVAKIEGSNSFATEDGYLTSSDKNLPLLYLPSQVRSQINQKISDKDALFALKLASLLIKSDYNVVAIRIVKEKEIVTYDHQGIVAIFTGEKSADLQVDSLQQVLSLSKINSAKITKIDLRFDKPIVTFAKSR